MGVQTPWWMVVVLGMGIVFLGLGLLVLLCNIMRVTLHRDGAQTAPRAAVPAAPEISGVFKQKLLAAVTAAIAEAEGSDAPGFRIVSFVRRQKA